MAQRHHREQLGTHLNFVPEMPEEVLKAGYKWVLNTIYDRHLDNYFARCWASITISAPFGHSERRTEPLSNYYSIVKCFSGA